MSEIAMPRLSDTMEEGTILRWLKHDGEHVGRGEELVEIETDKAAMTYESDSEGTLEIVAREGDTLAVGAPIARVGEPSANVDAQHNGAAEAPSTPPTRPIAPATTAPNTPATLAAGQSAVAPAAGQPAVAPAAGQPGGERVKASPLARRIARERGVNLGALSGSGPGGRIVKADVEAAETTTAARGGEPATSAQPEPAARETKSVSGADADTRAGADTHVDEGTRSGADTHVDEGTRSGADTTDGIASSKGETTAVEPSRTQRTIARRMAESKATIPDFTLTADIDMERCVDLRAELKRLSQAGGGPVPTYNDMIVKACALALRESPRANASYRDGRFELHSRVNVGVAVAAGAGDPTGGALVVATVFDADTKALGEIARETRMLAERVRDGSVAPPELSGGTFTVSNLGMYGIRQFTAIVNPPQAAILAVGAVASRAVVRKKKIVARSSMSVTLSCDHRILYGADAALFLSRIRELLEEPAALTL